MAHKILFVCLGNICRSPMAEGVFSHLVERAGLQSHFFIDSAGTGGHHAGEPPDSRMIRTAGRRGLDISAQRARKLRSSDFQEFDFILAMDRKNLRDIQDVMARTGGTATVRLFREFDPQQDSMDVPDPWFGGMSGFEEVADLMERTCANLLDSLRRERGV